MARTKGSINKFKLAAYREKIMTSEGLMPLDYMLKILRDELADPKRRDEMAKAAAPYVHPRLAQIHHQGDPEKPLHITDTTDWSVFSHEERAMLREAAQVLIAKRVALEAGRRVIEQDDENGD